MTRQFKLSTFAALAALCVAPSAFSATGGGGATLPAKAYHGINAASAAAEHRVSNAAEGSLFYEALAAAHADDEETYTPNTSYCQVGSGTGRKVLEGVTGYADASLSCPDTFNDSFVSGTNGFSAPNSDADFAGSDAPGTAADFSNYVTNKGTAHGQMTQFPSVAGLISVVYNNADYSNVFLTEAELCNIFAGKITNWNQLVRGNGAPFASKAITLVYRSDNSGTSFNFSNHLNWVCQDSGLAETLSSAASALPFTGSNNFTVNESMAAAFPGGTVPTGAIGVSGNPAVISKVLETDGAIGYAETANVIAATTSGATAARIAAKDTVELSASDSTNSSRTNSLYQNSLNHSARFEIPSTFTDKGSSTAIPSVYTDRALQANDTTYGRPIGTPTALTSTELPQASNCVFFVHPGSFATSQYVTAGDPTSGYSSYPIVAVTYLMGNYNGNASTADARTLLGAALNYSTLSTAVTSVGANTGTTEDSGYYWLRTLTATTQSGGSSTLNQNRINACTN